MSWPTIALISTIVVWVSLIILLTKWPRFRNKSISQHSASFKEAYIFFTTVQVIFGLVLYLFMIRWFIPHFQLSLLFTIVYSITAWLQIVSAFFPDTIKGRISSIHQALANGMAIGILLTTVILAFAPSIHSLAKVLIIMAAIYMAYGAYVSVTIKGKPHLFPNYLLLQVIYIVSFQAVILYVAFYK